MMEIVHAFEAMRWTHIVASTVALVLFFIPAFTRKGGRTHKKVGIVYWYLLAYMVLTAVMMSVLVFPDPMLIRKNAPVMQAVRRLNPTTPEALAYYILSQRVGALFTAYLATVTLAGLVHGLGAVRTRSDPRRLRTPLVVGLNWLIIGYGVLLGVLGIIYKSPVLLGVSPLGPLVGIWNLRYVLGGSKSPMHWWYEHLAGMISSAIATWTAFLVISGGLVFPGISSTKWVFIFWILPSVVGYPMIAILKARYRRKFHEDGRSGAAVPVPQPLDEAAAPHLGLTR